MGFSPCHVCRSEGTGFSPCHVCGSEGPGFSPCHVCGSEGTGFSPCHLMGESGAAVDWASMVQVGLVVRPHGLRGQVVIAPDTDFGDERFAPGAQVWRQSGASLMALTVAHSHSQADRWVVAFDGVTSVEAAEGLRGVELRIPETARMPLGPDEYYLYDLVGCQVQTGAGVEVGPVKAVYTGAGGALLGVDRNGAEVLVPLVKAMCPEIDVVGRRIVVDPPEGLLDVNAPAAKEPKETSGSKEESR